MILFRILRDAVAWTAGFIGLAAAVVHTHQWTGATPHGQHVIAVGITAAAGLAIVLDSARQVRRSRRRAIAARQQSRTPYGY
jgi:hypothetical protein